MLKQLAAHHCRAFIKWFSLSVFLVLMLSPVVLLELDTWRNILLKIYGVETFVTVTEKNTHVDRIFIPRVGWNEYQYWTLSYSLKENESTEINRVDNEALVRNIEPGSTVKITYIPGRQGYSEVSDNMSTFMHSLCSILKVFFVALLGIMLVVMVCATGLSTPLKNNSVMKG